MLLSADLPALDVREAALHQRLDLVEVQSAVEVRIRPFEAQQFLNKEKDIRKAVGYENETPTTIDFMMLYIKLIKHQLLKTVKKVLPAVSDFILDVQKISYDMGNGILIDGSFQKYNPSEIAVA